MPLSSSLAHYQILTAMLAPALFMTATSSLIMSANNRLARIVDRLRHLLDEFETAPEATLAYLERQIERHRRRSRIVLRAGRLLYLALSASRTASHSMVAGGGLRDHVVGHARDAAHLVDDAVRHRGRAVHRAGAPSGRS
jgi:hypothetical protein